MVKETTNTTTYQLTPKGEYTLTVNGRPEKRKTASGKSSFRIWKFKTVVNGEPRIISILLFPWESEELLLALGGVEIDKNQIEWDDEQVDGKSVTANIIHVEDNNGDLREKIENVFPADSVGSGGKDDWA